MFRIRLVWLATVIAFAGAACSESPDGANARGQRPAAEVRVIAEELKFEYDRARVEAVGTSEARLSADIYAPTSGEVVAVKFEPGQAVKAGEVLVELDSRKEVLALRVAELKPIGCTIVTSAPRTAVQYCRQPWTRHAPPPKRPVPRSSRPALHWKTAQSKRYLTAMSAAPRLTRVIASAPTP